MNETNSILCPCCGKMRVDDYDVCDNCAWENDPVQRKKPDFSGGANEMSLNQARAAYSNKQPVR